MMSEQGNDQLLELLGVLEQVDAGVLDERARLAVEDARILATAPATDEP